MARCPSTDIVLRGFCDSRNTPELRKTQLADVLSVRGKKDERGGIMYKGKVMQGG